MAERGSPFGAPGPNPLDGHLGKGSGVVALSSFSYLFSQLVQYWQSRVDLTQELEQRLAEAGHPIGERMLEVLSYREKSGRRETRLIALLQFVHSTVWRALFGKPGDGLEKSKQNPGEYYIFDNAPITNRYISVPKDLGQLNCAAFIAGIIAGILDGAAFPASVHSHTVGEGDEQRTVFIVQFDKEVLAREEGLDAAK